MSDFPRTTVGGVSLPRLIIGSNWFLGFSHTSQAQDSFITSYQTPERVAAMMRVFVEAGCDAVMSGRHNDLMREALDRVEQATGREIIRIVTPHFNLRPGGPPEMEPERVFDACREEDRATFCMPHQCMTDALVDRRDKVIRDLGAYTAMIRERGMLPGLSTHMPETVVYADANGDDVETYIQLYNSLGFLMQVEVDWVMNIIREAERPVMTIKPLAAGRLAPAAALPFVWSTIREEDMVTVGCLTPEEARECIEISHDVLARRGPQVQLQKTRSKASLSLD